MQGALRTFWSAVRDIGGQNDAVISIGGSTIVANGVFWSANAIFILADLTGRPQWLAKYKMQADKNVPVDRKMWMDALKTAIMNLFVSNLLFGYFVTYYPEYLAGCSFRVEDVPSIPKILLDVAFFFLVQEFGFYYMHRMFHIPFLYKHVHKKHHRFTAPIGIAAVYAAPAEQLICNTMPVYLGHLILGSHVLTFWIFLALLMLRTTIDHSGYHLPFLPSPEFHDFHHMKFNCNYGTWGLLDWLHGTDKMFTEAVQKKRNRVFFNLTPISTTYPTPAKKRE